jgi:hypothetical protein
MVLCAQRLPGKSAQLFESFKAHIPKECVVFIDDCRIQPRDPIWESLFYRPDMFRRDYFDCETT